VVTLPQAPARTPRLLFLTVWLAGLCIRLLIAQVIRLLFMVILPVVYPTAVSLTRLLALEPPLLLRSILTAIAVDHQLLALLNPTTPDVFLLAVNPSDKRAALTMVPLWTGTVTSVPG